MQYHFVSDAIYSSTFTFSFSVRFLWLFWTIFYFFFSRTGFPRCALFVTAWSHHISWNAPMLFLCIGGSGINGRVIKVSRAPAGPWESSLHSAWLLSLTHQRFVRLSYLKSCSESAEQYLSLILRRVLLLCCEMQLWMPEKLWWAMKCASTWLLLGYFQ